MVAGGKGRVQHSMQGAFIFVLLGLFALMSTLMVLLGAQMYRATVDSSELNNEGRLLGAYVRSMVRAMDGTDSVEITQHGDITALGLRDLIDDEVYVTWLYVYEGQLCELFCEREEEFFPERGSEICPAHRFVPSLGDGLLTVKMTDGNDRPCTVNVALRCA